MMRAFLFLLLERLSLLFNRFLFLIFLSPYLSRITFRAFILPPWKISNPHLIALDDGARIDKYSWIKIQLLPNSDAKLSIGRNSSLGRFVHLVCSNSIVIGADVMINERVYISDTSHTVSFDSSPPLHSEIYSLGSIEIGDGVWIGEGSYIYGNLTIGERSILGANSVLRNSIPPYEIWAGSPAKKIRDILPSHSS